jgi:hypothetical protein
MSRANGGDPLRGFSYALRGRSAPDTGVRVELLAPSGAAWSWGDPGAVNRVSGPALVSAWSSPSAATSATRR